MFYPSLRAALIRFLFQDNKVSAVIPREVAEYMRRSMRMRRMDSATTLRSAQNDDFSS